MGADALKGKGAPQPAFIIVEIEASLFCAARSGLSFIRMDGLYAMHGLTVWLKKDGELVCPSATNYLS